jgi:DNA replication protein DnaD
VSKKTNKLNLDNLPLHESKSMGEHEVLYNVFLRLGGIEATQNAILNTIETYQKESIETKKDIQELQLQHAVCPKKDVEKLRKDHDKLVKDLEVVNFFSKHPYLLKMQSVGLITWTVISMGSAFVYVVYQIGKRVGFWG